jgi:hypothetical protein
MKLQRTALIGVVAFLLLTGSSSVSAGAACFSACCSACCAATGGPAAFAGPLGILVDYTGCFGICLVACGSALWVPPACFANDTIIAVSAPDGTLINKPISAVHVDDQVLTLVDGQPVTTRVVRNVQSNGSFDFFEFEVRTDRAVSTLKVTPQHSMLLVDPLGEMRFSPPADVSVGDKMQSSGGSAWKVSHIGHSMGDEKFTLVTTEGSVLASGVLVSTICEEEINVGLKMGDVMQGWKLKHPYDLQKALASEITK